jgi:putative phage-type endonuclease
MEQGSPEWLALRVGKITGSRFKAAMDRNKRNGQPNKPRRELVRILRDELRTGFPEPYVENEYMALGTRCEPLALEAYKFITGATVHHAAFLAHPTLPYVGYSPDGFVPPDGLIEIKCPALEGRHTRTVESQKCPDDYYPQVQGGLWVSGCNWAHFISYFPSISVEIVRVERDETFIKRLADECASVWAEVNSAREDIAA